MRHASRVHASRGSRSDVLIYFENAIDIAAGNFSEEVFENRWYWYLPRFGLLHTSTRRTETVLPPRHAVSIYCDANDVGSANADRAP